MNRHCQPADAKPWALLLLLLAVAPASAQVSTEVRLCLMDYSALERSGAHAAALDKLRECARAHPDVYQLQKTLGKKLAELHAEGGDAALAEEAVEAYAAAAALDPGKFAGSYSELASLQESLGRTADAIASWETALPHLMISERQVAEDALWLLYKEGREDQRALDLWPTVSYRHGEDLGSLLHAAGLMRASGRLDEAKDLYKRALDSVPDHPEAQAAYTAILAETASSGGSADKNDLLDAWLPKLPEADDDFLDQLMGLTREVFRPDAERAVAQELLRRDPENAEANLSIGEAKLSEGDTDGAARALKKALAGGLSASDEGRAHAVLGRLAEQRTHARYSAAPNKTGTAVINAALSGYDLALSHYSKAAAAGARVEEHIANVRRARSLLDGSVEQIRDLEVAAAKESCAKLSAEARYGYDRDRPLVRHLTSDTPLSVSAGAAGDGSNLLAGGTAVDLRDAAWKGGRCWLHVRAPDGRSGWLQQSRTR